MKYIIDIEEKPLCVFDEDTQTYFPRLWRVKGFNSLVFDEEGLSRLEELNSDYINEHFGELQDTAYQKGLEDAWNIARKITVETDDGGVSISALYEMFGTESMCKIMKNNTVYDATDKLKAYEKKYPDKIKVGDEVTHKSDSISWTAVVTQNVNGILTLMGMTGAIAEGYDEKCFVKTGRHFDIEKILEAMK